MVKTVVNANDVELNGQSQALPRNMFSPPHANRQERAPLSTPGP